MRLESKKGKLSVVKGDISDRSTSERAVAAALNLRGKLHGVILNAAILRPVGPAAETGVDEWKRLFDVNFFGLLHTVSRSLAEPVVGVVKLYGSTRTASLRFSSQRRTCARPTAKSS